MPLSGLYTVTVTVLVISPADTVTSATPFLCAVKYPFSSIETVSESLLEKLNSIISVVSYG